MTNKNILVSVHIITFNQEKYIDLTLESILKQKVNFDYEIVIGEDCSTDRTKAIILEFTSRYPELIKIITSDYNVGFEKNFIRTMIACIGKYIAICEGDDYWLDEYKLQKQVDFLENNEKYGLVYSDIKMINEEGLQIKSTPFYLRQRERYKSGDVFWDLLEANFINSLTTCFRNGIIDFTKIDVKEKWYICDYWVWLEIALLTKIKFMNEKFSAYRVHSGGLSRKKDWPIRENFVRYNVLKKVLNSNVFTRLSVRARQVLSVVIFALIRNKLDKKKKLFLLFQYLKHPYLFKYILSKVYLKILFHKVNIY